MLGAKAIAEIDITASDMLEEFMHELDSQDITFAMMRVKQDLYAQLKRSGMLQKIGEDRIFPTINTAVKAFQEDSQSPPETSLQSIEGS
ncbi:STAS domain-containing protein [[Limnothrix rosea] IAM M-220]|uniref:STAS domain-containing protein n=1 Tax=[Limnothrix rosea] IAM M-220 TaxID=454133 RepID=UPI001CEC3766|nr:sodium-independent anion transporter [[Limnothrix rosea] IAM M-220]